MSEFSEIVFPYPAKIIRPALRALDAPSLLDMLKSKMHDTKVLEGRDPFFWASEISNNNIDAYFTHMLPTTLENFATDAAAGVSFVNSHRHNELPFGRSLSGAVEQMGNGQRVVADFFTMPGLNLNGISTDDFITGVQSGIIQDVSVGFHGGKYFCSICQTNYLSYECPHVAGMEYQIQGGGMVTCTVGIDGARLAEVSAVYDGATPDATILKAQRMADDGELKPEALRMLESRYRMRFTNKRSFAGVANLSKNKEDLVDYEQLVNQIREVLDVPADGDVAAVVVGVSAELAKLRTVAAAVDTLTERIRVLETEAADGRMYRGDLVSKALAEGVRALGAKFNTTTYESILRSAPLETIKQMAADWAAVGDVQFAGGRQTVDKSQAPGKTGKRANVPEAAYKS